MFLLLCIYQSEASLLFWVKKGQNLKPPIQAHSFIYMQCLRGKSFRQRINIHPSLSCAHDPFTEFRDPFFSKVSVQRDPPASICRYRGCRLLSRSVGTFSLRLGRNVKRLTSLRICTPRSFFFSRGSTSVPIFGNENDLLFCHYRNSGVLFHQ